MAVESIGGGWNAGFNVGEKKKEQSGSLFADILTSLENKKSEAAKTSGTKVSEAHVGASDAREEFLAYMQKTPAQRMEDAWLKQHKMTREQLDAMSPEEREKIIAQMRQEIEEKIKQMTKEKLDNETKFLI